MMTKKIAIATTLLVSASLISAGAAMAQEPENSLGCLHMSKQVSTALSSNTQAANYKAAQSEQSAGQQFCLSGLYAEGISHYSNALKLLGTTSNG